jgi:hypothetical protein
LQNVLRKTRDAGAKLRLRMRRQRSDDGVEAKALASVNFLMGCCGEQDSTHVIHEQQAL